MRVKIRILQIIRYGAPKLGVHTGKKKIGAN